MSFPLSMLGGGGLSTSATATSGNGDQGQTLDFGFQNSAPFSVTGSGKSEQVSNPSQTAAAQPGMPINNNTLLLIGGITVLAFFAYRASR
jgi:hypothetical protein